MLKKDDVAYRLAQRHYIVEPGITQIYRVVDDRREAEPEEPVKLLEVNEETLPLGIRPIYFRPHFPSGIDYPAAIIEITGEEFAQLQGGEGLRLPDGWRLAEPIERAPAYQESTPCP